MQTSCFKSFNTGSCLSTKRSSRANRLIVNAAASTQDVEKARQSLTKLMDSTHANPIMIRLAWHDSGSYSADAKDQPWPKPGGATASIRFKPELGYGANNGLDIALNLLGPIKDEFPEMSWADLIQLSSAVGIEHAGGPHIPLRIGRLDAQSSEDCTPDGRLPAAAAPFPDRAANPAAHLRAVFSRMGLSDKDIVALSGAHTLGRARPERSGFGKASTKYTANGPGAPGGSSWTVQWLKFDNSYFADIKEQRDAELLVLPTDAALFEDDGFRPFAEKYAASQDDFFADYVESHLKLSELGVKWA
jgi:L-ascorbate peroxidase